MVRQNREDLKRRQEETLTRMKETRYEDAIYLRDYVGQKLDWAIKERQKGLDLIKDLDARKQNLEIQIQKLNGAINVLQELKIIKKPDPTPVEQKEKKNDDPDV